MADPAQAAAVLARALEYPYATPEASYLYRDGKAAALPPEGPDLSGRSRLIAYGANAAPAALGRKLTQLPGIEMPAMRFGLEGFDVAYSAHVSPYGAVPATLVESPGALAPVFLLHPTAEQLGLLTATELNYDLVELNGIGVYRSKHGPLELDGAPVALAAIRSSGRTLPELDQPAILERVRSNLEPDLSLEQFIHASIARGGMSFPPLSSL